MSEERGDLRGDLRGRGFETRTGRAAIVALAYCVFGTAPVLRLAITTILQVFRTARRVQSAAADPAVLALGEAEFGDGVGGAGNADGTGAGNGEDGGQQEKGEHETGQEWVHHNGGRDEKQTNKQTGRDAFEEEVHRGGERSLWGEV